MTIHLQTNDGHNHIVYCAVMCHSQSLTSLQNVNTQLLSRLEKLIRRFCHNLRSLVFDQEIPHFSFHWGTFNYCFIKIWSLPLCLHLFNFGYISLPPTHSTLHPLLTKTVNCRILIDS